MGHHPGGQDHPRQQPLPRETTRGRRPLGLWRRGQVTFAPCLPAVLLFSLTSLCPRDVRGEVEELMDLAVEDLLDLRVIAAARHDQLASDAPAAVTVVTAEEIRCYGYQTLGDVLRGTAGFYTTYDRNYSYLGVRGFGLPGDYNTRVLLLIDGARVNDNIYGLAPIGTDFPLDLASIDRVEIVRGPGSALYGTNAFFGIINVITARPATVAGGRVRAELESAGTYSGRIGYAGGVGSPVQWQISATAEDRAGRDLYFREFDDPATKNGQASGLDGERFETVSARLIRGHFSLQLEQGSREKDIPTASFGTMFGDDRARTTDTRTLVALAFDGARPSGPSYQLHLAGGRYRYEGAYPYAAGDAAASAVNNDGCDGIWIGAEALGTLPVGAHRLTLGTELRRSARERQWSREGSETYLDIDGSSTVWGAYLQVEAQPLSSIRLVGGVRHDRYESFGGTTNPRIAAIFKAPADVRVKLLYGTAFRAPNQYELRYYDGRAPLDPETITTREAILERTLDRNIEARVSIFDNDTRDLLRLVTNDEDQLGFVNAGAYEAKGAEIAVRGVWSQGWRAGLRYTRVSVEDERTGKTPPNSPTQAGGANLAVPFFSPDLCLGAEVRYLGPRPTVSSGRVEGYVVADLSANARVGRDRVAISASVYNLLDQTYGDPGSEEHLQEVILQDGRGVRCSIEFRF